MSFSNGAWADKGAIRRDVPRLSLRTQGAITQPAQRISYAKRWTDW